MIAGRSVTQACVIESSTSVSLNGRVDLQASFGARPNSVYQPSQFVDEVLPFSPTQSGTVLLGRGSLIRILPETDSRETTVGRSLALRSVVNVEGRNIAFQPDSVLLAPNARVALRAGNWVAPSPGRSRLIQSGGQVFLGSGAMIDVSGTTGVIARLNEKIFTLQLRGAELADSPLQRNGMVRGAALTVDMRKSGTYGGREWVGTPLGDATGFEGLVERGAGALTTAGGSIEIAAGDSFVFQQGALMDVSGGWTRVEGGLVKTTRLLENGRLVDVSEATPDRQYDGIYTGESSRTHQKWGITKTFRPALAPTGEYRQETYFEGADAGWISVSAPAMVLEGKLVGGTIAGERQVRASATSSDMPVGGELRFSFRAQNAASPFYNEFPTPPTITFQTPGAPSGIPGFSVDASDQAARIPADRLAGVTINPAIFGGDQGFASLTINNEEGTIIIPQGVEVGLPAAGRLSLTASNIRVGGSVSAPGGTLEFRALNISPFVAEVLKAQFLVPTENPGRGIFTLESGARLSAAGRVQDDRVARGRGALEPFAPDGGTIRIEGFAVDLAPNSVIDVSGGFAMSATGNRRASNASGTPTFEDYGDAGSITIAAGQDPNEEYVIRGRLNLGSELRGYGANRGGTLAIQAPFIHVGGGVPEAGALVVSPDFFQRGGFENFRLSGLGAPGDRFGGDAPGRRDRARHDHRADGPDRSGCKVANVPWTTCSGGGGQTGWAAAACECGFSGTRCPRC